MIKFIELNTCDGQKITVPVNRVMIEAPATNSQIKDTNIVIIGAINSIYTQETYEQIQKMICSSQTNVRVVTKVEHIS